MSLARLVVAAVRFEGRGISEVARDYRVSRQWIHRILKRFDAEGEGGLEPRSRRPRTSPRRISDAVEDEIVEVRKSLSDQGLDAGAHTIAYHLAKRHGAVPSVATIWRTLSRRGFVTPQPAAQMSTEVTAGTLANQHTSVPKSASAAGSATGATDGTPGRQPLRPRLPSTRA